MITIYKYDVPAEDYFELELPIGAQILTVQSQFGEPHIWVLGDTEKKSEVRYFRLLGTGHDFKLNSDKVKQYIGTFQIEGGMLVFHLFEIKNKGGLTK